jgi:hypothetical protein
MIYKPSVFRATPGLAAMLTATLTATLAFTSVLVMGASRPSLAQPARANEQVWPVEEKADDADETDADAKDADAKDPDAKDADTKEAEAKDADIIKDIDPSKLDWSQLAVDASTLNDGPAAKARAGGSGGNGDSLIWSGNNRADGAAVSVKQAVSPFLDTRIGADMNVVRQQPKTSSELLAEKLANGGAAPQSSGTAWAAITAPGAGPLWDKTAVEARVDPGQDQTRLGTSLSKTVPLADQYSLSLQHGYNVTQQGMVAVPGSGARATRSSETDQSAKLSVFDTGTSVSVSQTMTSSDEKWLRKVGAEQKVWDGLSVSGAIGETGHGATSKSISAGFKRSW